MNGMPEIQEQDFTEQENKDLFVYEEKRVYSSFESVFAWICVLVGYLFCRAFPPAKYPLGMLAVMFFGICVTAVVLAKKNAKFGARSIVAAVTSVAFAFAFIFNTEPIAMYAALGCSFVFYCFFVYCATGNYTGKSKADILPLELFRAVKGVRFSDLADMFSIMFAKKNKTFRVILRIIIGFGIALIPTAVVISLLSYDGTFAEMMNEVIEFLRSLNPISHISSLLLGLTVAMYLFGIYAANTDKREPANVEKYREVLNNMRIAPALTVGAALLPLAVVYIVFFISQWHYYVSGFTGALPNGVMNYADYARSGFFELCAVSAINFAVILAVTMFMRRKGRGGEIFLKIVSLVFSVMTLVLIGTAMAKMVLYIDRFGLTEKRVLASWFMVLLAVVFVFVIVRQFAEKFKLITVSAAAVVVMSGVLVISNYTGIIADYNVEMYISGENENIDIYALDKLGTSAIPAMVRLAEHWDSVEFEGEDAERLDTKLEMAKSRLDDNAETVFSYSLPVAEAREALEDYFGE